MGVCNYSMFCCTLLYVHSSFAIILMGKRELVALLSLSSWCLSRDGCVAPSLGDFLIILTYYNRIVNNHSLLQTFRTKVQIFIILFAVTMDMQKMYQIIAPKLVV